MAPNAALLFLINIVVVAAVVLFATAVVVILLRRADQRRLQEQKLAAVGTATARILHQIKNPLQTILLHTELLDDPRVDGDREERRTLSRAIVGEAERLSAMLAELSQWAAGTQRQLSLVPLPLDALVRQIGVSARGQCGVDVEVRVGAAVHVLADGYFLQQAIENLVRNACDALRDREGARLVLALERVGRVARLYVSDNGPGIPPDRLSQIFEPFVSSKGNGMGLGLPIAREIVEGHNGQLEVESDLGRGTTFRIVLPVALDAAVEPVRRAEPVGA